MLGCTDKIDVVIPYSSDEQANAATKDPHFKLLFRLLNFVIQEDESEKFKSGTEFSLFNFFISFR